MVQINEDKLKAVFAEIEKASNVISEVLPVLSTLVPALKPIIPIFEILNDLKNDIEQKVGN